MTTSPSNIPEAAVEAAVKAWDHHWGDRYGDEALEEMGEEVRVALEAAAPHMRQAFYLEMNLRAVQDELRATPIYPLGKIEDKR